MRVAVLTLTRDRLAYTQHAFATLRKNAGIDFDHIVLDQGSSDGTPKWLKKEYSRGRLDRVGFLKENIGINRGMNMLLDWIADDDYDVIVKADNDIEVTQPDTLRIVATLSDEGYALLSPRIEGLNNPPPVTGEFDIAGTAILDIPQIGGIFIAAPGSIYRHFRHTENAPLYGSDDMDLCWWFRGHGGRCGYVKHLLANHYETTSGQHARYPDYFERTLHEGKPAL